MTLSTRTHVSTPIPSRYINRLCKHWAHKLEVEYDETQARIRFDGGQCLMRANEDGLDLEVQSETPERLAELRDVVDRHFVRVAWQEELSLDWV